MRIAVVIPCYKVKSTILSVVRRIGPEVNIIYLVDDNCPEKTADYVEEHVIDTRLRIIRHKQNKGVGGAVISGYTQALEDNMEIIVKIDGDGQMDPGFLRDLVSPIINFEADYVKGNRFFSLYDVRKMPWVRVFGNAVLSFMTKMSSGYWKIFDPTNGFTAISAVAAKRLNFQNISERYFFETDMLINLGGIRAVVQDFPMEAVYGDEKSNLRILDILFDFIVKHLRATTRRILYLYFLRDFSIASINFILGLFLITFGTLYGSMEWYQSIITNKSATAGTVMIAVLPIILGFQMMIVFLSHDIANEPTIPLIKRFMNH